MNAGSIAVLERKLVLNMLRVITLIEQRSRAAQHEGHARGDCLVAGDFQLIDCQFVRLHLGEFGRSDRIRLILRNSRDRVIVDQRRSLAAAARHRRADDFLLTVIVRADIDLDGPP